MLTKGMSSHDNGEDSPFAKLDGNPPDPTELIFSVLIIVFY